PLEHPISTLPSRCEPGAARGDRIAQTSSGMAELRVGWPSWKRFVQDPFVVEFTSPAFMLDEFAPGEERRGAGKHALIPRRRRLWIFVKADHLCIRGISQRRQHDAGIEPAG